MSSEIFKVGLSLRSRSLGRAIRTASTRRTIIHPEAIGIVAMAMAGERTGIWGMSIGKIRRGTSKTLIVGDARDHLEQAEICIMVNRMGSYIEFPGNIFDIDKVIVCLHFL